MSMVTRSGIVSTRTEPMVNRGGTCRLRVAVKPVDNLARRWRFAVKGGAVVARKIRE